MLGRIASIPLLVLCTSCAQVKLDLRALDRPVMLNSIPGPGFEWAPKAPTTRWTVRLQNIITNGSHERSDNAALPATQYLKEHPDSFLAGGEVTMTGISFFAIFAAAGAAELTGSWLVVERQGTDVETGVGESK